MRSKELGEGVTNPLILLITIALATVEAPIEGANNEASFSMNRALESLLIRPGLKIE